MRRVVIATVQNKSGILNRITGMLHRRQFNIESISASTSETPGVSKMTLVVKVRDHSDLDQLIKQLHKQIDVLEVEDITDKAMVARELALVRIASTPQLHTEIQGIIAPFRATVVDVSKQSLSIQVTGKSEKIDALLSLLRPYGIKELTKTGVTAFLRGDQPEEIETEKFVL